MLKEVSKERLSTYKPTGSLADPVNVRILTELRQDPRLSMSELGRRVGLSSPAVTERVRRMEETGVIRGYSIDINPAALGLHIAAYIRLRPDPALSPKLAQLVKEIPEIVECHHLTGEDCYILKVYLPGVEQLDEFLDTFLHYGTTTTSLILSSPVPPRPLPLPQA